MKSFLTINRLLQAFFIVGCLLGNSAVAQQSRKISIQGYMKDPIKQTPLEDGSKEVTFKLYPSATGGTPVWSETQNVELKNGVYNTYLGIKPNELNGPASLGGLAWGTSTFFLELSIANVPIATRTELTFAPYSLGAPRSAVADTALFLRGNTVEVAKKLSPSLSSNNYANFGTDNKFSVYTSGSQRLVVTNDGKVGVGTANPTISLAVGDDDTGLESTVTNNIRQLELKADNNVAMALNSNGVQVLKGLLVGGNAFNRESVTLAIGDDDTGFKAVSDGVMAVVTNGNQRVRFTDNGRVGIGTTDPQAILHVRGTLSQNPFPTPNRYFGGDFSSLARDIPNIGSFNSLFEGDVVSTAAFIATKTTNWSDKRLKNIVRVSDAKSDLETLNKIEITDYQYIDKVNNGDKVHKKVIAQQVASVFPQATTPKRQVLPNVYELTPTYNFNDGVLTVTTKKAHDFAVDDEIMLKTPADDLNNVKVIEIVDKHTFKVKATQKPEQLFVYGKYANDVLTVDYNALSMLNVSATQELLRKIEALEKENKVLESINQANVSRLNKIEASLQLINSTTGK